MSHLNTLFFIGTKQFNDDSIKTRFACLNKVADY